MPICDVAGPAGPPLDPKPDSSTESPPLLPFSEPIETPESTGSILIVDDDEGVRSVLCTILRRAGYAVETAPSIGDARERLTTRAFDLALLDIVLPDGSGMDLLEPIRANSPGAQVLVMTGSPSVEVAAEAVRGGAVDFLTKPIERAAILQTVGLAIGAKRLADDRARLEDEKRCHRERLECLVHERTRELQEALVDRKRVQEALRAAETQRNDLLDALEEQVTLVDTSGRVVWANRVACESAGLPRHDLIGRACQETLWTHEGTATDWPAMTAIRTGEATEREHATVDGRSWWIRAYPMRDRAGVVTGAVEVSHEVTRKKTQEQDERQEQKMLAVGHLAAGIAHEINTPIQFVGDNLLFLRDSSVQILALLARCALMVEDARRGPIPEDRLSALQADLEEADLPFLVAEIPGAIDQSMEGTGRVAEIVRAMKEFAHPGTTDMAPADINEAIRATITIARNEWKYVSDVRTELDPDIPPVPCLLGEFNQVVLNLIVNARDAIAEHLGEGSTEKGTIVIATRRAGSEAIISVQDSGGGIPESIRDRIFDPFFTTKEIGKGSGQGLAIAHNVIVEKHGGKISVECDPGAGTRFVLRLPLACRPPDAHFENTVSPVTDTGMESAPNGVFADSVPSRP